MRLEFTQVALSDLKRLREFIALKNPQVANRYSESLQKSIAGLIDQPLMGRQLGASSNNRELVAGDYLVRYRIVGECVFVFKVRHSKER